MPGTLLSIFPNPDDLLALEPEELGAVILEVAPGLMQNSMFNIAGLLAPLFPQIGKGYPVGLHSDVRLAVAEALSWLTNQGLVILDPDQPASWYRLTRLGATLKTRADVNTFRKLSSGRRLVEEPEPDTRQNAPSAGQPGLGFEANTPLPLRARAHPGGAIPPAASEIFPPPPVSEPPSGATPSVPSSGMASTSEARSQVMIEPLPDEVSLAADLPDLPAQGPGPHFELTTRGVIDFVPPEALDRKGNNVARLRQLHPTLRHLARELAEALGTGNIPHVHLAARIEEYLKRVDQTLDTIDFTLLYVEGVRLANAEKAAIEKVAEGELPPLRENDREELETLLQLHGTFMLATITGAELIAAEQRYRRRPEDEREYRAAAVDFAASLQNQPDVINPDTAAFVLGAAEQIGHGANPERSGVVGTTTVLNVAITLAAVAAVPGLPFMGNLIAGTPGLIAGGAAAYITSEIVKRSRPFAAVIAPIIAKLDREVDFRKFKNFLLSVEQKVRRLANYNEQFSWVNNALHWVKGPVGQQVMASAAFLGTAAMSSSSSPDDFVIRLLNTSGEIGISALTERAQNARGLQEGQTLAFRGSDDAIEYVQAAEAEGFTFAGKKLLGP